MDGIVQLVRNALCCIKDLELFQGTILYDTLATKSYLYHFPEPLDKTTPLEVFICLSQFYAFVSCTLAGYRLMTSAGIYKLRRLTRVAGYVSSSSTKRNETSDALIRGSISCEADAATRSVFVGMCVMPIGISFFWLFANSLHVTEAGWIGGLPALILALTVMEIALMPLLYYMIKDAESSLSKSKRMIQLSQTIASKTTKSDDILIDWETFGFLSSGEWKPFWAGDNATFIEQSGEQEMAFEAIKDITIAVESLLSSEGKSDQEKLNFTKAFQRTANETAEVIQSNATVIRLEGYREYFYFLLNFIAFYGYLMGIICYLYDNDEIQPSLVTLLKFKYSNAFADWAGNFAGDLMWTIEPFVILSSPFIINVMRPKSVKTKID
jgi:hypothetical protein